MSKVRPISSRRYIQLETLQCPLCLSKNLNAGPSEYKGNTHSVKILYFECDSEWIETWKCTGYSKLNARKSKKRNLKSLRLATLHRKKLESGKVLKFNW